MKQKDGLMNGAIGRTRSAAVFAVLVALVASTMAIVSIQGANAFPGANGKIAFESGGNIWTMNEDGSAAALLRAQGRTPSWSADGSQIAFTDTSSSDFIIYKINANGSGWTKVSNGTSDFDPTWSPDGEWIAFRRRVSLTPPATGSATATDGTGVTLTDTVTANAFDDVKVGMTVTNTTTAESGTVTAKTATTLTVDPGLASGWTAGNGYEVSAEGDRIYKVRSNGTGEVALSSAGLTDYYDDYAPAWSPDGTQIAYATKRNGNDDIYVMSSNGEGAGAPTNLTGDILDVAWDPTWSPDGSKIAFSSADNGAGGSTQENIWTMDAAGTNKAIITAEATLKDEAPTWSPDGDWIAFERTSGSDITILKVPSNGGVAIALTTGGGATEAFPDWQPTLKGVNDSGYAVDEGGTLVISAGSGTLVNDETFATAVGTVTAVKDSNPSHGSVTLNANGSFTYTHDDSDTLVDSFTYHPVQGGVAGSVATVTITINPIDDAPDGHLTGLVDPSQGRWFLYDGSGGLVSSFYFGNPGDYPFMGDWDGDGVETPGLYRQSDGYVYLRNSNTAGPGEIKFFFGNPGDVPIAGDFNNDGFDTVSIYRPSNQTFYIINKLGKNDGGLGAAEFSYVFGNPGDKPFVGDFDGDGVETVGLHRESTGLVYFRNTHTQGNADAQFIFGDPGDKIIAGDWNDNGTFSPGLFRPSNTTMYFRYTNTQGNADNLFIPPGSASTWLPVSGNR